MKRLAIIVLALVVATGLSAQTITRTKDLKTTDLGNQVLRVVENDSTFALGLKTGKSVHPYVVVALGKKEQALKLLNFLLTAELGKGDIINFENETNNCAKYSGASGYTVYSEGRAFSGHLRKPNIKGFIKAIHEYWGDEIMLAFKY